MVLLQSLGNAGKQRSLRHILSYMKPNVGVTAWRRAAINGLRHFSCNRVIGYWSFDIYFDVYLEEEH
ncbi:hypothetical protein DPMN_191891 [Dreissena polymorpha]|uniref:Uncharacterized protein n=1 Tax=Dreissena polymorpha TaxID=45954 RepID=A0A9D4B5N6_DREPO|nr:hypothetical protein DPMN_191891 [Dreissena polymorpha]